MMLSFPTGRFGAALLLMRVQAAAIAGEWSVQCGTAHPLPCGAIGVLGLCVLLGSFARAAALALCIVGMVSVALGFLDLWAAVQSLVLVALGLSGAGAFSMDARFFGRQVIRLRP